jgi:hypothetical protein
MKAIERRIDELKKEADEKYREAAKAAVQRMRETVKKHGGAYIDETEVHAVLTTHLRRMDAAMKGLSEAERMAEELQRLNDEL